ncbi:MAG: site-2 protease family protein [Candidatus Thorarchaeota archaeon]
MDTYMTLLIIAGIYLLVYIIAKAIGVDKLDEKGINAGTPGFIMWKTERLNAFLTKMGKKFPRAFFNVGVIVGFGGMAFGLWMFTDNLIKFFVQPEAAGGVVPIIPGVTIVGPQLFYMLIGLAITLLTHEFSHGLAAAKDNIPIKSSGLLFFLVLFGGFVEPDEEVFENEVGPKDRLRLLAAGSYSNLIWAFVFFLLMLNMTAVLSVGFNTPSGAYIYDVTADSPGGATLEIGDVIIGLNDTTIDTWTSVSVYMGDAHAGDQLTIHYMRNMQNESSTITLGVNPQDTTRGYIGVYGADYWEPKPGFEILTPMFAFHFQQIVLWSFIILLSVALFNLLPIPVLDGDKMLSNALSMVTDDPKKIKYVMWPARIFSLSVVILSMVMTFITGKALF